MGKIVAYIVMHKILFLARWGHYFRYIRGCIRCLCRGSSGSSRGKGLLLNF